MNKDHLMRESLKKTTKILAGKNVPVVMEGLSARVEFDPKTKKPTEIVLPMVPDNCPGPLLEAVKGISNREAAHLLYSDPKDLTDRSKDRVWHLVHNMIDDNYINMQMAEDFRGTHSEIKNSYKYVFENADEFKEDAIKEHIANDRKSAIASYLPSYLAHKMGSPFNEEFYQSSPLKDLYADIDKAMSPEFEKALKDCSSSEEVAELTGRTTTFFKEYFEELDKMAGDDDKTKDFKEPEKPEEDKDDGKGDDESEGEGDESDDGEDDEESDGGGDAGDPKDDGKAPAPKEAPKKPVTPKNTSMNDALDDLVEHEMQVEYKKKKGTFFWSDRMNEIFHYKDYKTTRGSRGAHSSLEVFDRDCKAVGSYLRKLLERMLASRNRVYYTGGYKSGRLTSKQLAFIPLGKTDVFSKKNEVKAINSCVEILIDLSGSMCGSKVDLAGKSAYALADCLEKLKIPFAITGFWTDAPATNKIDRAKLNSAYNDFYNKAGPAVAKRIVNPTSINSFCIFKDFAEPFGHMQKSGLMACANSQVGMCQNEDATHVRIALERLSAQPQEKKVLFVLSDGSPYFNSDATNSASKLAELAKNAESAYGVSVVGIGIQTNSVEEYYPRNVVVNKLDELPNTLLNLLHERVFS